jgi:tRNA (mo5U34)-methyltransferase
MPPTWVRIPPSPLPPMPDADDLRNEIIRLGPWHLDVQVTPEISTAVSLEAEETSYDESFGPVSFQSSVEKGWKHKLRTLYPGGLQGRSVLDCACNCGAYLFWAKDRGAGRCRGFDVREHWIEQARFLQRNREGSNEDVQFEVRDLMDLPGLGLEPFDITVFTGVLYHLADPIGGLQIAAGLTKELLFLDTATTGDRSDDGFVLAEEAVEPLMSGVHGLAWRPTGPHVLRRVLAWAGFEHTHLVRWVKAEDGSEGRLGMLAARQPELLEPFTAAG